MWKTNNLKVHDFHQVRKKLDLICMVHAFMKILFGGAAVACLLLGPMLLENQLLH
jgi:hypothetical protein